MELNFKMNKLLEKSIKVRNEQAISKLANMDSLKEWGNKQEDRTPPKFKVERVKKSVGLWNLMRQFRP